jgi:hypothetical protein
MRIGPRRSHTTGPPTQKIWSVSGPSAPPPGPFEILISASEPGIGTESKFSASDVTVARIPVAPGGTTQALLSEPMAKRSAQERSRRSGLTASGRGRPRRHRKQQHGESTHRERCRHRRPSHCLPSPAIRLGAVWIHLPGPERAILRPASKPWHCAHVYRPFTSSKALAATGITALQARQ